MKRFYLAALVLGAALFLLPTKSEAQIISVFTAVGTNADSTTTHPAGMSNGVIGCGTRCDFRVWSDAGSAAVVTAYCRIDSTDSETWYPCAVCTNPSTAGCFQTLATARQYKFAIESWSSGAIHVKYFTSSTP